MDKVDRSITGVDDPYQFRVLTLSGSTSETFLKRRMIRNRTAASLPDALDALAQGNADAVAYDAPILRYRELGGNSVTP